MGISFTRYQLIFNEAEKWRELAKLPVESDKVSLDRYSDHLNKAALHTTEKLSRDKLSHRPSGSFNLTP